MATPYQVEPRRRKTAWAIAAVLLVIYLAYSSYVLWNGIQLRERPPVSVTFVSRKDLNLRLPCFATYYFPLNQNPALQNPGYVIAPNVQSFPSTLNITCIADTNQVERSGRHGNSSLENLDVNSVSSQGKVRVLSVSPESYSCFMYESPLTCTETSLEVVEIPYSVRGHCNVSVEQADNMTAMADTWSPSFGPLPGPILIKFHTHELQLKPNPSTDLVSPFLSLGIHGLFFTETMPNNDSQPYTLERGALFAMHYPTEKDPERCLNVPYTLDSDAVSTYQSVVKDPTKGLQTHLDLLAASSSVLLQSETLRGFFSAVGPSSSEPYNNGGDWRKIKGWYNTAVYQQPGAVTGVSLLPTQQSNLGSWPNGAKEAKDEETLWIPSSWDLRTTGREDSRAKLYPARMLHPINLGLYADIRGMQVSRQVDPLSLTILYNSLYTGAGTFLAIFGIIFVMKAQYAELETWPPLARLFWKEDEAPQDVHVDDHKQDEDLTVIHDEGPLLRMPSNRPR